MAARSSDSTCAYLTPSHIAVDMIEDLNIGDNEAASETEVSIFMSEEDEERISRSRETFEAVREAADFARAAALSCRKSVVESNKVLKISLKRMDLAAKKANGTKRVGLRRILPLEVFKFNEIAEKCRSAINEVSKAAVHAEKASVSASSAAKDAHHCATELLQTLSFNTPFSPDKQKLAVDTVNTTKGEAVKAFQKKYLLLRSMKICMWRADYKSNPISLIDRFSFANRTARYVGNIAPVFTLVLGCAYLYIPITDKLRSKPTFVSGLITPVILITASAGIYLFRIYRRCIYKRQKSIARNAREQLIEKIWKEIQDLEEYFKIKGIEVPYEEEMTKKKDRR